MRRFELVAVLAGLVCALSLGGTAVAGAAPLPPAVEGNLAAITEFQYRMLNVTPSAYRPYPVCHRGCQKLWKAARALSASNSDHQELWREMFFLGKSTSMFAGFGNYMSGQTLPTTSHFEEWFVWDRSADHIRASGQTAALKGRTYQQDQRYPGGD